MNIEDVDCAGLVPGELFPPHMVLLELEASSLGWPPKGGVRGVVYLVAGRQRWKIGVAYDMDRRLKQLECGAGIGLHLVAAVPCDAPEAAEGVALQLVQGCRCRGEWFRPKAADKRRVLEWFNDLASDERERLETQLSVAYRQLALLRQRVITLAREADLAEATVHAVTKRLDRLPADESADGEQEAATDEA